ncbi:MAG: ribonuclease PH [Magnetococcales bacterium]|nr:ribonuclease PH [Magnetococcales bacterium]MBF0420761.1 ribonuclease PH [Magnetococcales bacterium]
MSRRNDRKPDQLRPVSITRHFVDHAEGSCLITCGNTRVLCTASIEEKLPPWMRDQQRGWITAEYGMLPRSTHQRSAREASRGKQSGRTLEIQRLIGRSMRSVVNLDKLGKRTIWLDCDVIQADGGTRTASITGAFIALTDALRHLHRGGIIPELPITNYVAAVSCGLVGDTPLLDLDYEEDSHCQTDMNFVMTSHGHFVEIQGTAEGAPFSHSDFNAMLALAQKGIAELITIQRQALA